MTRYQVQKIMYRNSIRMYHTEGHSLCYWQGSRTIDMLTLLQGFVFQNWLDLREAFKYSEFFPPCTEITLALEKFHIQGIIMVFLHNIRFGMERGLKSAENGPKKLKGCKRCFRPTLTCFFFCFWWKGPFFIK